MMSTIAFSLEIGCIGVFCIQMILLRFFGLAFVIPSVEYVLPFWLVFHVKQIATIGANWSIDLAQRRWPVPILWG